MPMSSWGGITSSVRLSRRSVAFSKAHTSTVEGSGGYIGGPDTFGDFEARRFRYALYKALWQNTAYDKDVHPWAAARNRAYGHYRFTRGTNTPAYRLAEVFATHVFNGRLDMRAGDGRKVPSAIPIETDNEAIRRPIARFWRDSNFAVNKAILCRTGAVCGDAPFFLNDNVRKRRIEGEPLDPACLRYVARDHQGNVQGYIRQEYRPNPEYNPPKRHARERSADPEAPNDQKEYVLYTEYCWREGEDVVFRTYRGEGEERKSYDWRGTPDDRLDPEWEVAYGFVPLVIVPHIQTWPGQQWGFGEYAPLLAKVDEVNDLGSKLHDQIRKTVEGAYFFAGVQDPRRKLKPGRETPDPDGDAQPDRQEMYVYYAGIGATATPLILPLDIQFTSIEIMNQRAELEMDSPVLRFDRMRSQVSGDASAKALREARKPAEGAVQERRANYDDMLVRAHKMAISMGSFRGYPEYEGFGPDAYESGKLDHAIGWRSVYGVDPIDEAELQMAQASAAATWKGAGVPIRLVLEGMGWNEEKLGAFDEAQADEQAKALEQQKAMIALNPPAPAAPANGRPKPDPASTN